MAENEKQTPENALTVPKPDFNSCWVDEKTELLTLECSGVTFIMREMTADEQAECYRRAQQGPMELVNLVTDAKTEINIDFDGFEISILSVAFALGARNKISKEGWDDERPVTEENVRRMPLPIIQWLAMEHKKFFRPDGSDEQESEPGDPVVLHEPGKEMVPSAE